MVRRTVVGTRSDDFWDLIQRIKLDGVREHCVASRAWVLSPGSYATVVSASRLFQRNEGEREYPILFHFFTLKLRTFIQYVDAVQ
jgi:hypothetical protein